MQDREYILSRLAAIEKEHDVRILHACESGSRAWGFPSKDSDFDVRFIYVSNMRHYLRVPGALKVLETEPQLKLESVRDELDSTNLRIENRDPALYDLAGWDLRFALELARKGNAVVSEWMNSPIVYSSVPCFREAILKCIDQNAWQPERSFYHYRSLVLRAHKEHIEGKLAVGVKKYMYALRSAFAALYVEKFSSMPPLDFKELMNAIDVHKDIKWQCELLLKVKSAGAEVDTVLSNPILNAYLLSFLFSDNTVVKRKASDLHLEKLNDFFYEWAATIPDWLK